jgi:division/cell wall cluster transcriptional repressor MraZ
VFTGEYRHSVDEKGRIAIPSRFRARLDDGAFVARWIDTCLAVFPRDEWDRLAEKVAGLPLADAGSRTFQRFVFAGAFEVELDRQGRIVLPASLRSFAGLPLADAGSRTFQRFVFAGAFEVELDRQGRIVLPASLRSFAGLAGEAVVVGSRDHAEIWAPAAWDEYRRDLESPEALAAALSGLGI